jgi:hypothetical protein
MLGKASLLLLREHEVSVPEDVKLALPAGLDLGFVLRLGVQLGRETRGPFVVAVSDRAVLDHDARHGKNLHPRLVVPVGESQFAGFSLGAPNGAPQ